MVMAVTPKKLFLYLLVYVALFHTSYGFCDRTFTSASGTLQSPGFPSNYSNGISCTYVIRAPGNERVTLNFTEFDLQQPLDDVDYDYLWSSDADDSCVDYVEIRDGDTGSSPKLGRFCGNELPGTLRSFSSGMWINLVTDGSVVSSGFRATYTTGAHDESFLLFRINSEISRTDIETGTRVPLAQKAWGGDVPLDYDPVENRVYWTQSASVRISFASLSGSDQGTISVEEATHIDDFAIDPYSRLLFYVDSWKGVIAMMSLATQDHRTMIKSGLYKPHSLALHTAQGIVFWADSDAIDRVSYDGSDRKTIVSVYRVSTLSLDQTGNRLYWLRKITNDLLLESSDLAGKDRSTINLGGGWKPGALAVYRDSAFVGLQTTGKTILIRQTLGADKDNRATFAEYPLLITDMYAFDQNSSSEGLNGCGTDNGGCSVFCVPLPGNQSHCLCPDGQGIAADNTCGEAKVIVRSVSALPFTVSGTTNMSLTCELDRAVPHVEGYTWSVQCLQPNENRCIFQPRPEQDGTEVTCTVHFVGREPVSGSLTLSLEYPPQDPPYITGYGGDSTLQTGDRLILICNVPGGKPIASGIIFFCEGHADDKVVIQGQKEAQSVLTIDSLRKKDNGARCTCYAKWRGSSYKNNKAELLTLRVQSGRPEITTQATTSENDDLLIGGTAGSGAAVLVLIAVCAIVIKIMRRSTYEKPAKRRNRRRSPDEHPYAVAYLGRGQVTRIVKGDTAGLAGSDRESGHYDLPEDPPQLPPRSSAVLKCPTASLQHEVAKSDYLHPIADPNLDKLNLIPNSNPDYLHPIADPNLDKLNPFSNSKSDYLHPIADPNLDKLNPIPNSNPDYLHPIADPNLDKLNPFSNSKSDYLHPIADPNLDKLNPISNSNPDYLHPIADPNLVKLNPFSISKSDYLHSIADPNLDKLNPIPNSNPNYLHPIAGQTQSLL